MLEAIVPSTPVTVRNVRSQGKRLSCDIKLALPTRVSDRHPHSPKRRISAILSGRHRTLNTIFHVTFSLSRTKIARNDAYQSVIRTVTINIKAARSEHGAKDKMAITRKSFNPNINTREVVPDRNVYTPLRNNIVQIIFSLGYQFYNFLSSA